MGVMSSSVYSPGTTLRRACRFPGRVWSLEGESRVWRFKTRKERVNHKDLVDTDVMERQNHGKFIQY